MFYGYGILNNHVPTLKATAMKVSAALSPFLTSLYAVYKAESNANDSLGTYNGTAQGGLTYTTGKSGNAFTGNGTNAWVNLPNNMFKPTGDFSISQWVYVINKFDYAAQLFQSVNYKGTPSTSWGIESLILFSNFQFTISNGSSSTQYHTTAPINSYANQWVNITITRKASTNVKVYINGTLTTTQNWTQNPVYDTTAYTRIGVRTDDKNGNIYPFYNGMKIDETLLYDRELTSAEASELYNAGAGKFYPTF
jgi:hypothetical protein